MQLLLISQDSSILDAQSTSREKILALGGLFEMLHVIVIGDESKKVESKKIANNVWLYGLQSHGWWQTLYVAYKIAKKHIFFRSNLQADIIFAEDPFEAGLAAWMLSKIFGRKLHLHTSVDFLTPHFRKRDSKSMRRFLVGKFLIQQANGVSTPIETLTEKIKKAHRGKDVVIRTLSEFVSTKETEMQKPRSTIRSQYPHLQFIIVIMSDLVEENELPFAISVFRHIHVQYKHSGLFIVGVGPKKSSLEHLIKKHGLENNIFIAEDIENLSTYLYSANLLLVVSPSQDLRPTLARSAMDKIPTVVPDVGMAQQLSKHVREQIACPPQKITCFVKKTLAFLEKSENRTVFRVNTTNEINNLIQPSKDNYCDTFQEMIEETKFAGEGFT